MAVDGFPTTRVRRSLDELPETMAVSTAEPNPNGLYVVRGHERALDPDSALVVGDRGTGLIGLSLLEFRYGVPE